MYLTDNLPTIDNASPESYVISGIVLLLLIIAHWKIFTKAGKPGWAVLIPIYNVYVLLKIIGRPWYWLIFLIIPIVNIVTYIVVIYGLARAFGKGLGYTLLMLILPTIGQLVLGFGSSTYQGPRNVSYKKS